MNDDIFIGIVTEQGSTDVKCSGVFKFDPIRGYEGKLLLPYKPKAGPMLFDLPPELNDKETLYCLIDGSNFGTIIWPNFDGGNQIKNFSAQIITLNIRHLLKGIHVHASEPDITKITLRTPIFARLFLLTAFKTTFELKPPKLTIESVKQDELHFQSQIGQLSVGTTSSYSPDALSPSVSANSHIELKLANQINPVECVKIIARLEYFFSLLTFSFVKAQNIRLGIMSSSKKGEPKAEKEFELERALLNEDAKTDLDRLHVPLRLTGLDIAKNFDRFLEVFDSIEQTLYWYRIVIAEERYLEDKYFYCVRMIESVYRNLKLKTEGDEAALGTVKQICEKLSNGKKDCELIKFIKQRVVPIFNKPWSLTSVVKDLKLKYAELKIVQILDEKTINDLRGKHAHGTSRQFSARDYKFMTYSYELLTVLYVLTILESCGIERAFLLRNLKQSHAHSHYFSDEHLAAVTKDLNQV